MKTKRPYCIRVHQTVQLGGVQYNNTWLLRCASYVGAGGRVVKEKVARFTREEADLRIINLNKPRYIQPGIKSLQYTVEKA